MIDEIVVGLDHGQASAAALDWAARQAQRTGWTLRAVHVLRWPYGLSERGFPAPADSTHLSTDEIRDDYRAAIDRVYRSVSPDRAWELQFAMGQPGEVLVQQSAESRLLCLGTGVHAGWHRLLEGSTSHYCFSHAHGPTAAIP